jgi:alpha-tubulin suppressor-like RCC1 family protein
MTLVTASCAGFGCQEATQVELMLSTDLPCDALHGVAVTVGPPSFSEDRPPTISTNRCDPATGKVGSLVIVPSADEDAEFSIRVTAAVKAGSVEDCVPSETASENYAGCIVARRTLRYRSNTRLYLSVDLAAQCQGTPCGPGTTCARAGVCEPAPVKDVDRCTQPGVCGAQDPAKAPPSGPDFAAGGEFACAIDTAGALRCWGRGAEGQTGGTPVDSLPVQIGAERAWKFVRASDRYACAIAADDTLWCWGSNADGQFGNGSQVNSTSPTLAAGGLRVQSAAVGLTHACATTTAGELFCWGLNNLSQVGPRDDGSDRRFLTPERVGALSDWASVSVGAGHSCALREGGELYCWGSNAFSQAGKEKQEDDSDLHFDGFGFDPDAPIADALGRGWKAVSCGFAHTCGLDSEGQIFCWGDNSSNQLGAWFPSYAESYVPRPVEGLGGSWREVSAGNAHTCAVNKAGELYCWGNNAFGQLGSRDVPTTEGPVLVDGGPGGWLSVRVGQAFTCARTYSGQLWCWGQNASGQLGNGTVGLSQATPSQVTGF